MNGCFMPVAIRFEDNPMARENMTTLINTSISVNPVSIDFGGSGSAIDINDNFLMVVIHIQSDSFR